MEDIMIKCPICGREHLPAEIFFPDDLIGHPTEIIRDTNGHIEFYLGDEPNYDEIYVCDECGTKFSVHANISFDVEAIVDDASEEYVTKFKKTDKIRLKENQLFD